VDLTEFRGLLAAAVQEGDAAAQAKDATKAEERYQEVQKMLKEEPIALDESLKRAQDWSVDFSEAVMGRFRNTWRENALLLLALFAPSLTGQVKMAMGEANGFRSIFFLMTFFSIGAVSNFKKLWEEGIGRLAALDHETWDRGERQAVDEARRRVAAALGADQVAVRDRRGGATPPTGR